MIDLSKTIDLSTTYLGLKLKNPLVASSSPMCEDVGNIRRMEDAGAAAVVLHSLFEEQIDIDNDELDRFLTESSETSAEATSHFPEMTGHVTGPDAYLKHIAKCKQAVKIPVIASLNGTSTGGWLGYAKQMQQAGADALELNIYNIAVDYRWLDSHGKVLSQRRRSSGACREDGPLPNLTIVGLSARPGQALGTELYAVQVLNDGAAPARLVTTDIFVDGAQADTARVDEVDPGETTTVRITGPACVHRIRAGDACRRTLQ